MMYTTLEKSVLLDDFFKTVFENEFKHDLSIRNEWKEKDDKMISYLTLPGYKKEDFSISITDSEHIKITGKSTLYDDLKLSTTKLLSLPKNIDLDSSEVGYEAGILKLSFKKKVFKELKIQ